MNVIFVGGGRVAKELLDVFSGDEEVKILSVIDLDNDAVGMIRARELGIATSNSMEQVIQRPEVSVILEVTGSIKVRQEIVGMIREDQDIISAGAARMMNNFLTRQAKMKNLSIADEISSLKSHMGTTINTIDEVAEEIEKILKDNRVLAFNARIEATRLGEAGAAFSIIGEKLQDLILDIQKAVNNINDSSSQNHQLLEHLEETEEKLRVA